MRLRPASMAPCLIGLSIAFNVARADVAVVQLPPAAAARGIPLQVGDILREGDDPARLDVFRLLYLETVDATRAPVQLRRIRAGAMQDIELPAGNWDLIAVPVDASGTPLADLDAALAEALAANELERAAALQLTRARLSASRRQFADAAQDFSAAAAQLPSGADWIAQIQARAFEQHPDRKQPLHAAERAVELRRAALAPAPLLASSLQLLAFWRAQTRDNPGALQAAEEAVRLAPDTLIAANAHVVQSFVAMRSSQPEKAAAELDLAATLIQQIAPDGLDWASLLARRAVLSAVRREGDLASQAYADALAELRRLAPDSMLLGRTAFNAQLHALERRRYAEAESLARESMAVFATTAPDSLEYAQARAALAEVLMRRTEYVEAEALLREAWLASDTIDPRSYEALSLKLQLGDSQARQLRFAEALTLYDEIQSVLSAADAPPALGQTSLAADTALYRADLLLHLDRCAEAIISANSALDQFLAQQRPGTERWEAQLLLSECDRRLNDLPGAVDHAKQASEGFRAIAADGIQQAQAQFALARALRDSGRRAAAIDAYRSAIDELERHRDRVGGGAEIRARWVAQFQDFYKELMWMLAQDGQSAAVFEIDARYRIQSLLQLLGEDHADLASAWSGQALNSTLATQLPADTALLSFVVGREGTLALVALPGAHEAKAFALPATRATLDSEVDRMLLLGARSSDDPQALEALARVGQGLHDALIAPLRSAIDAYPRYIVVADGPLLRLPWAALVVTRTPQLRYLVEERVLSIAPSASVWSRLALREPAPDSILAFADPAFESANTDALRSTPLGGLPGARHEVDLLAATFPDRVTRYFGAEASEARLRAAAPKAGTLHFALHSVIDASEPLTSYIVFAAGKGHASSDDGRLHADEIARELHLDADLVVLSSCASAGGAEAGGEGLLSLIRALHLAGTRAVIGTTWPVADRSTARLMGDFYRHRNAGLDSAEALVAAQRDWLANARDHVWRNAIARYFGIDNALPESALHPFYWAGFVHSGAPAR